MSTFILGWLGLSLIVLSLIIISGLRKSNYENKMALEQSKESEEN